MHVKLTDIAQNTGFSVNTVSRALRNDPKISSETKAMIQQNADELGYIRNHVAGSMRSNKTHTIGIVSADSSNPFFAEVLLHIEDTARKLNYQILLINTEERAENEYEAIKLLLGRQVDGLIVIPVFNNEKNRELYSSLTIPYIFAGRRIEGLENHSILHGDVEGARQVFDHFIRKGHKKILYLAGPEIISNTEDRMKGLFESFEVNNLPIFEKLIVGTNGHIDDGYTAVNHALNKGLEFTAISCFNDLVAMGALKSLYENGFNVPTDIEVFGYDNLQMSQYMQPRLSSVDITKAKLGQLAVEELVKHIEFPDKKYKTHFIKPRLIFRETTSK